MDGYYGPIVIVKNQKTRIDASGTSHDDVFCGEQFAYVVKQSKKGSLNTEGEGNGRCIQYLLKRSTKISYSKLLRFSNTNHKRNKVEWESITFYKTMYMNALF